MDAAVVVAQGGAGVGEVVVDLVRLVDDAAAQLALEDDPRLQRGDLVAVDDVGAERAPDLDEAVGARASHDPPHQQLGHPHQRHPPEGQQRLQQRAALPRRVAVGLRRGEPRHRAPRAGDGEQRAAQRAADGGQRPGQRHHQAREDHQRQERQQPGHRIAGPEHRVGDPREEGGHHPRERQRHERIEQHRRDHRDRHGQEDHQEHVDRVARQRAAVGALLPVDAADGHALVGHRLAPRGALEAQADQHHLVPGAPQAVGLAHHADVLRGGVGHHRQDAELAGLRCGASGRPASVRGLGHRRPPAPRPVAVRAARRSIEADRCAANPRRARGLRPVPPRPTPRPASRAGGSRCGRTRTAPRRRDRGPPARPPR